MQLNALRVQNYRCIGDSGWVSVDDLVCLIGRNESGKTAFMEAVQTLSPAYDGDGYTPYDDYPREEWTAYSDRHEDDPDVVASARFDLDTADVDAVEDACGDSILDGRSVTVSRDYDNDLHWDVDLDERACLDHLREEYDLPESLESQLAEVRTLSELPDYDADDRDGPYADLASHLDGDPETVVANDVGEPLGERLPAFRYIGEYSVMDGTIRIADLVERREADELTPGDRVFLSLLAVAGLDLADLQDVDDWRQRTTELETASATVSERAMNYWGQSGDIRMRIQATGEGDDRLLDVRVENRAHDVTVGFEQRSTGFRRFFSTFCTLSALQRRGEDVVVLLDEPGLNLHARAKQDFLDFLKTELAPQYPLIYTTHSPFMIDAANLRRTKMVRADPVGDENVFTDVSLADGYTQFPLRNVFELDLMDTLLVHPQTLLVEGKADHVYLYVLSKMLRDAGETGLDDRWTVIPITDGENIDSFVSLFGGDSLNVAALLSEEPSSSAEDVRLTTVPEYTGGESTIEDVLSDSFYLEVVNRTYATEIGSADGVPDRISRADLDAGSEPIVARLRSYFGANDINDGEFARHEPALYLQENRADLAEELDGESRRNFTGLFTDLNNTLASFEGVERRSQSLLDIFGL